MKRNLNIYPIFESKNGTNFLRGAFFEGGVQMTDDKPFDIHAFVEEISEQVASVHNHPFHQHLIAMLAIETKLYHEAQSYIDAHGITIVNNGMQECINPALKICHKATQNVLKIRKLLGLSR